MNVVGRLVAVSLTAGLALPAAGHASPSLLRFEGSAAVTLHEVVTHEDYRFDQLVRHPIRLTMEMTGVFDPDVPFASDTASGWAEITRADGSIRRLQVVGRISPPRGSGGTAYANAWDDNGDRYCFSVVDQSDAPTPREDRVVAMLETRDVFVGGYLQRHLHAITGDPMGGLPLIPTDMCPALDTNGGPVDGDFAFRTLSLP